MDKHIIKLFRSGAIKYYNDKFLINNSHYTIFNTIVNVKKINKIIENSHTLSSLNFNATIGTVVWNQVKHLLTNDNTKSLLIYSSNIEKNTLIEKTYKNISKKTHINKDGVVDICLLLNRGYGTGDYKFNYHILETDKQYLVENHLIIIKYAYNIEKNEHKKKLTKITESFDNNKTKEFVKLYFGNNAINCAELVYCLPIFGFN
jgi:5-hydroxyisourate hydrolase-like protein (transthyretin family)